MREREQAGVWTDDEVDHALSELYEDIKTDQRGLTAVRENLMAAASGAVAPDAPDTEAAQADVVPIGAAKSRRARPARRWWAAAAAVVVLAVGGVVAQTVVFTPSSATAQAREALTGAAELAARARDAVVPAGHYRYLGTHAWWAREMGTETRNFSYLNENVIEVWIPADPEGEWVRRRRETGNRKWLEGTEAEARAAGVVIEESPWPEQRAKGGNFVENAPEHGNWQFPKPQFVAGLPTDPERLYERLRADSGGDAHALVYAADALRAGMLPAAVRATLLRALTFVPGLDVTDNAADLDGRRGVALGVTEDGNRQEIILDPATGEVIGERQVSDSLFPGVPPGTVTSCSSVTTAVVGGVGERPAG
ncbi:CU044_5270 family protein [Actinosynnema sp. NPDC050436]|uniref:CU044_5270 family protein n=1 Tax=Actinosynnema sp. NPDC050436 TaxID=3155659 RepID=UPI0033DE0D7A